MRLGDYDYTALEHPPTWRSMLRDWREVLFGWLKPSVYGASRFVQGFLYALLAAGVAVVLVLLVAMANWVVRAVVVLVLVAAVIYAAKLAARRQSLMYFAADNGLEYIEGEPEFERPGMMFRQGHSRGVLAGFRDRSRGGAEIANYTYTTGSGKHSHTVYLGFISLPLKRHLPHIVLDARDNNLFRRVSNLPEGLAGRQKLGFEGDFDQHFTVYVPNSYERDALYILTPDIMQLLIDDAGEYDVEIVDDRLYLYSAYAIPLHRPAELKRVFALASRLSEEFERNTNRYVDERVGDRSADRVAEPGARLRPWLTPLHTVVIIAAMIVIIILLMFNQVLVRI